MKNNNKLLQNLKKKKKIKNNKNKNTLRNIT